MNSSVHKFTPLRAGINRRAVLCSWVCAAFADAALARTSDKPDLTPGRVAYVSSGHGFTLKNGRKIRLGSIEAPKMAYEDVRGEPLATLARKALYAIVQNRILHFEDPVPDRYSRIKAQCFVEQAETKEPLWVQGEMIRLGWARVHTWQDDHARANQLLILEEAARANKSGLWAEPYYAVRKPETIGAAIGSFQIVQGRIIDAALVRKRVYLNFGADWRKDFTISIAPKDVRRFTRVGIVLAGLSGARVRARGLVRSQNGPILYLNHPEALEVLPN